MSVYDVNGNNIADVPVIPEEDYKSIGETVAFNNGQFVSDGFLTMFFLDCSYKFFSVANIKAIIDQLHDYGINVFNLGFMNGRGCCLQLDDMTIEANGTTYDLTSCLWTDFGNHWDEDDMDEILEYAKTNGVEIIPLFESPGHFRPFLSIVPQFVYGNYENSLDINNPDACNYALACAELYIKWFASRGIKRWNIGVDEFADDVAGYTSLYDDGNYIYADFVNRSALLVAKYNMVPFAFNDPFMIRGSVEPFINRQVPVMYWAKSGTTWGTASQLASYGYKLINSSSTIYWVGGNGSKVTEQKMRQFNIHNFQDGSTISDPVGACFCVWNGNRESPALNDGGNAITTAILPLIAAYGETVSAQL